MQITTYVNNFYKEMGKLWIKSIDGYANRYSCDVKLYQSKLTNRPPSWNKILIMRELFNRGHEFVLWIDADALFVSFEFDILHEIEEGKDLYLVKHLSNSGEIPNAGVMLIRNSTWSKTMLNKIWSQEQYINHPWWEGAALIKILGIGTQFLDGENDAWHALGNGNSFLSKIKWLDGRWNSIPGSYEVPNPIIKHWAGLPYRKKLDLMRREVHELKLMTKLESFLIKIKANVRIFILVYYHAAIKRINKFCRE